METTGALKGRHHTHTDLTDKLKDRIVILLPGQHDLTCAAHNVMIPRIPMLILIWLLSIHVRRLNLCSMLYQNSLNVCIIILLDSE